MVIGIDLGATEIKAVLLDSLYEVIQVKQMATDDFLGQNHWKKNIFNLISSFESEYNLSKTIVGISAPGIAGEDNKSINYLPGRLIGLEFFDWSAYLDRQTWVINDANAAMIAESRVGVALAYKNVVLLTLGTGVGGSILVNGQVYGGSLQMAGHLGHLSLDVHHPYLSIAGMPGSLEDAIGNSTVSLRSLGKFADTLSLVKAFENHDTLASYVWLDSVRKLAIALCSICNILSPELIVIGGGIINAGASLFTPLQDFMDLYEWRPGMKKTKIVTAAHSSLSGAVGAAIFANEKSIA